MENGSSATKSKFSSRANWSSKSRRQRLKGLHVNAAERRLRYHKAIHLVVGCRPSCVVWIARPYEAQADRHRAFAGGERGGQGKILIAPAAQVSIDAGPC